MPTFAAKDCLSDVIGLKNDIVAKVFTCPECKTDVTISKYQVAGDLAIMCTRCNCRYKIRGDQVLDENQAGREYYLERHEGGKPSQTSLGYKVFMRLDATQKATAVPKDSWVNVMKPPPPKPPVAAPAVPPKPAPVAGAGPVAPAVPPAPKAAGDTPAA